MWDAATRSFISWCFTLDFISADIIFHSFLELHTTLSEKKIFITNFSYLETSSRYRTAISIDVLWMSVPDKNLTKCTLLAQRSPQALTDYHTMLLPSPNSLIEQSMQERVYMIIIKVQSITNHFLWKENKISLVYIKLFVV